MPPTGPPNTAELVITSIIIIIEGLWWVCIRIGSSTFSWEPWVIYQNHFFWFLESHTNILKPVLSISKNQSWYIRQTSVLLICWEPKLCGYLIHSSSSSSMAYGSYIWELVLRLLCLEKLPQFIYPNGFLSFFENHVNIFFIGFFNMLRTTGNIRWKSVHFEYLGVPHWSFDAPHSNNRPLKFQRFFIKLGAEFLPLGNKKFKNPGWLIKRKKNYEEKSAKLARFLGIF